MSFDRYAQALAGSGVAETRSCEPPADPPEIELQARWFAGEFGNRFLDTAGRTIEIVQPGVWNREPGPDFAEAAIRIDGGAPIKGSIEVDREVRDWERHGHAVNPAYDGVILHVHIRAGSARFFTRTSAGREVPQVRIDPAAGEGPTTLPLARPGRCCAPLRDLDSARLESLFEAAARHRMRAKSARLQRLAEMRGTDEALFQATAEALGYKENRLPLQLLAQRLSLSALREATGPVAEALAFGVAGFLAEPDVSRFPAANRPHVRALWEEWWRLRSEYERVGIRPEHWRIAGVRPANHPHRRVAALVRLAGSWRRFRSAVESGDPKRAGEVLGSLSDPFWEVRTSLRSRPSARSWALIGVSRVAEILANVVFPFLIPARPKLWEVYASLPAALNNRKVTTAAQRLFGRSGTRRVRTLAEQQALLQIYGDFCLRDASDCAACRFPEIAAGWETDPFRAGNPD